MQKVMMCDPPSGWKYGFPKALPKMFDTWEEQRDWLVSEGYPLKEIQSYGDHFYCRYWETEVTDCCNHDCNEGRDCPNRKSK